MADRKNTRPIAHSSELGAGTGFTYEDAVGAFFLTSLLSEGYAPGIENRIVTGVSFQQKTFGEPLDDVIVDFRASDGDEARLSLQVKRSLTISAAASNGDFREVIRNAWRTFRDDDFRFGKDRVGVAVGEVSLDRARAFVSLCQAARASIEADHFLARFADGCNASADVRSVKRDIETILHGVAGGEWSDADLHRFLASLVLTHFDFLHSGAIDPADAMTRLRPCLADGSADRAPDLWSSLCQTVRNTGGSAGQYDRPRLVRELSTTFPLQVAPSLRPDITRLTQLSHDWARDIANDVSGTHLERKISRDKLAEQLTQSRFVQINGLPGSGKSAVLRQQLESDLTRGPVIFLKSDRLEGRGWAGFATHYGLSTSPLADLLVEIAATGTPTLYIDGIDRVEKAHQPIVLDVLRTILKSPVLDNWRVVVSLRDTGIEPLRNWLAEVLDKLGVRTLETSTLDDDEAEELAKAKPQLRGLLFGPTAVRDIVRRPFFAKILAQAYGSATTDTAFEPQSEIDLIENWWLRGGYDSSGQDAINRRRAFIDLAGVQARHISQSIRLSDLSPQTVEQIDQLTADGLIRTVRTGLTVRFAHDILFEWAFYYHLSNEGPQWPQAIRACGEPPAVARAVELLSQYEFREGKTWSESLTMISGTDMRSQWTRAWLLGPISSEIFSKDEAQFEAAAYVNDFHFLRKALVWFQAEKTTPNPNVLAGALARDEKIRLADALSWPSDFPSWRRLLVFVLTRLANIPVRLYPDVASVFDVWQNACAGIPNAISSAIVAHCGAWLLEMDSRGTEEGAKANKRWGSMKDTKEFRQSLISILAYGARTVPQPSREYLERLIGLERLRDERFGEVVIYSPLLAAPHGALLVDLTLKHLRQELPDDKIARVKLERPEPRERGGYSYLDYPQFSTYDWSRLSLDHDVHNFWPASPLREPFRSLFKESPDEALRLVRELCNHAITSWRQLHRLVRDTPPPGTPLPLVLTFPWGTQEFWGTEREYVWYRGSGGPNEIKCGLFALEEWCFGELERGTPVDDLIKRAVEGNQCVAVLGIAVLLALHTNRVSDTVFPLVTSQKLWSMDHNRMAQDISGGVLNLAGFTKKSDAPHAQAVKALNERPARKQQLRWLAQLYVLNGELGERTRAAILSFKDDLPFQYEEQRAHAPSREWMTKQALEYAELADLANYMVRKVPDSDNLVEIQVAGPSANEPENVEARQNAIRYLQIRNLHIWSTKVLDGGWIDDPAKYASSLALARRFDGADLFLETGGDENLETRRSGIAGVAAVVLKYREGREPSELAWARNAIDRAWAATDIRSRFWSPQSINPWEPKIFVARGLGADISHGTAAADAPKMLLALVTHPLEMASLAAVQETAKLWDQNPKLAWAALVLAFELSKLHPPEESDGGRGPSSELHSRRRVDEALQTATDYYPNGEGWAALPTPPPAWVESEKARRRVSPSEDYDSDDMENSEKGWVEPPIHWYSQYAAKVLQNLPLERMLASDAKEPLLAFFADLLRWTNDKNAPPWVKNGRRDKGASRLIEWTRALGSTLGGLLGLVPLADSKTRFLDPVLRLEGDVCWSLLSPLVSTYICRYIYDAANVPADAIQLLSHCLERFLASSTFASRNYSSGEFHGFDEPNILEAMMFVSDERANGAARFVNGDWTEIRTILPIIDRLVRAGGWSARVMYQFLTLCERARDTYPANVFADQILSILENAAAPLKGWHGTSNAARIAGLIQHFASRDTPLSRELGLKLLRVLDLLVDMGDRRSAALELSEVFREIRAI
jgi:hypothetical protein